MIKLKKVMNLLIDSLTLASPGMLNLKKSLVKALLENRSQEDKITLIELESNPVQQKESYLEVQRFQSVKNGWIGRAIWYSKKLPELMKFHETDVLYSMSGIVTPKVTHAGPVVGTVNNMLPFLPANKHYKQNLKAQIRLLALKKTYIKSINLSDYVVLHSEYARKTLGKYCGDLSEKSFVVHTGLHHEMKPNPSADKGALNGVKYIFYLSAIYPYKNQVNLVRAYSEAKRSCMDLPDLVLAGLPADKNYVYEMEKAIINSNVANHIHYLGRVPQSDLFQWLIDSEVNVFVSSCETNSLVIAELLSAGRPILSSNTEPMPEIFGNAALYCNENDISDLTKKLIDICRNKELRSELTKLASSRANEMSWDSCGKAIWNAAYQALENRISR